MLLAAGCGQSKSDSGKADQTSGTSQDAASELQKAATTAAGEVQKAAETVKTTTEKAVADATKQVESATASATAKAQAVIDQAKALVSDKKYQEAMSALQGLAGMALTPEQQKLVDDLKATIQTALTGQATKQGTSALGNLLGGEKK